MEKDTIFDIETMVQLQIAEGNLKQSTKQELRTVQASKNHASIDFTVKLFTSLTKSKSVEETKIIFEGNSWKKTFDCPDYLTEAFKDFYINLDQNVKDTVYISKMEDLLEKIKEFSENVHNYWDFGYIKQFSQFGCKICMVNELLIKLWNLRSGTFVSQN